jgi:hypothetical protein
MSLAFQSVAPGNYFEFAPDCVLDADHRVHLEYKCREHGAELVNREWIVAFHQHVPTPLAHTYHEKLDLEIGWRLPLAKHLKDSLLGILILYRRTLRAFEPADYVWHVLLLFGKSITAPHSTPSAIGMGASHQTGWTGLVAKNCYNRSGEVETQAVFAGLGETLPEALV